MSEPLSSFRQKDMKVDNGQTWSNKIVQGVQYAPDMYSKSSPSVSYFPSIHDSTSYTTNNRLTLQQLHISTGHVSNQITTHSTWSNLIIPCQPNKIEPKIKEEDSKEDLTITEEAKKEVKKKNPYSIEELLKKPTKKAKTINEVYSGIQQPYGVLVTNEEYQSGSGSEDGDTDIKIDVE
ncbi:unnamed protein product [Brassicogethes aeneus]|uniref:Uncharacterized protein n=1 Tax=Brassicogethes aeneus TaxID=1431903 RepID=A0A9P0AYK1_BRAAE|nr:unnamed protein product [Brassicogethes aeneus]